MSIPSDLLWRQCKNELAEKIPAQQFRTWIQPIQFVSCSPTAEGTHLTLGIPSDFHRTWVDAEYSDLIQALLCNLAEEQVSFSFLVLEEVQVETVIMAMSETRLAAESSASAHVVAEVSRADDPSSVIQETHARHSSGVPVSSASNEDVLTEAQSAQKSGMAQPQKGLTDGFNFRPETVPGSLPQTLNPRYSFEAFIEADCNRLARSAGVAVANQPGGTSFNPFLIYGKVGLGKTHLAHAIGNQIVAEQPRAQVLYLTSEAFTNYFVYAIQNNTLTEFTHAFRQIDVLIVDDIQFFGGKEKTQEQFFHLFNDLHQRGKQIILCADRSPAEIAGIEERLLSRFRWGLSADVQPPDLETRTAILRAHAEGSGLELSNEVIDYIAYNVKDNIRLLEGAFNKLLALQQISKRPIDLIFVQDALQDLVDNRSRKSISASQIRDIVAEYFNMDTDLLIGKSRKRPIVDARQIAMHFCKIMTQHSLEAIGRRFGGRDHSTVIHACKAIQARIDTDPRFVEDLGQIEQMLKNRVLHS